MRWALCVPVFLGISEAEERLRLHELYTYVIELTKIVNRD